MPDRMFRDVVDPHITLGTRKWYVVPLSIVAHAAVLAIIAAIPLLATDVLPSPRDLIVFSLSAPLPVPPPPPPPVATRRETPVEDVNRNAAPAQSPDRIEPERPRPLAASAQFGTGVPGGIDTVGIAPQPLPPPAPPPKPPVAPLPIGGDVKEPRIIHKVLPQYPPLAVTAKVEGMVFIEAIITKDGHVRNARVLRGNPLLAQAALDAVLQWKYTPTLLNNTPVEVSMTVTVNFVLSR